MLEKYYEIVKHFEIQKEMSQNPKSIDLWINQITNVFPQLTEEQIFNFFKINCLAIKQQSQEVYNTKIFHIDDDVGRLLERTNNTFYNRHLPFNNMFFEYNLKVNNFNFFAFHIYKDQWDILIRCFYKKDNKIQVQKIEFFDNYKKYEVEKGKKIDELNEMGQIINNYTLFKDKDKKIIKCFFCNFIDFLNIPDVEIITVERTKEQNEKRILRGKLPLPTQIFIRISGELKIYLTELNSTKQFNYSHRFWVRGHFRTLRSNKWKKARGTKIWIIPFIKGKGVLVDKYYTVKKGIKNTKNNGGEQKWIMKKNTKN